MLERLSLLACSLTLVACAGTMQSGKPIQQFPSNAALQDVAHKTEQTLSPELPFEGRSSWELSAVGAGDAGEPTGVASMGPELATRLGGRYSEALGCVAHELARALAEHGTLPALGARRFIAGRCGAWLSTPSARTWLIGVPPGVDAAQVEARMRETLASLSPAQAGMLQGMQVGLGAAQVADRLALVATYGAPLVQLESAARVVDASGKLTLRGKLTHSAWQLQARINRGAFGVSDCTLDPALALPAFAVTCAMDAQDDHAWVQLLAVPPGRLVGTSVLEILALRTPDAARSYQPPSEIGSGAAQSAAEFSATALRLLNGVRGKAGLSPLAHAAAQSDVTSQVTLPFFQSLLASGKDADDANNAIMLGLLAGWSVKDGTIQSADMAASMSERPGDASHWLASALELPMPRGVLLDPHASTLALGLSLQPKGVAGLAVTYRFVDPKQDLNALMLDLVERLKAVRDARHLGDTILITDLPGLARALERIQTQGEVPIDALRSVLEQTTQSIGRSVAGFAWETYALEGIEFPSEVLQQGDLYLGAGIAQYKPQEAAWAQYAVLFAVVSGVR